MNVKLCKTTAALLAVLTMTGLFAACGGSGDAGAGPTVSSDTTAAAQTTAGETVTETTAYTPDVPDLDFEGRTAMFLVKGPGQGNWQSFEIWVPEQNGEVVNDSVVERNLKLEEKYNFKIAIDGQDSLDAITRRVVLAGDSDYDIVMPNTTMSATLAKEGLLFDLNEVPYIDLSRPWWDPCCVRDLSIKRHNYFCTGDIAYQDDDAIWVTMFNKTLAESYKIDDPYTLVREGKYTVDKLIEMCSDVSSDLNGDGVMGVEDMWGMVTAYTTVNSMIYSAGIRIVSKDENDLPYLTFNTEKTVSVLEKAIRIMEQDNISFVVDHFPGKGYDAFTLRDVFGGDHGLFYAEVMRHVRTMRAHEAIFGLLPFPKYDESIEDYPQFVHATATMVCVPITSDPEFSGFVAETMAAESKNTMTPAYYDVALTGKYMRDEESAEMLQYIVDSRVYDLAHIFSWGALSDNFTQLVKKQSTDFASMYESRAPIAQGQIDTFIEGLN